MDDKDFKVLIIDDSETTRDILLKHFNQFTTYQVFEASDGEEALKLLDEVKVHLIISDIVMPKIDGLTLMKELKYKNPEVPIILISGHHNLKSIETAFKYYALKFFTKPFEWDELLKAVKHAKKQYIDLINTKIASESLETSVKVGIDRNNLKSVRNLLPKIIDTSSKLYILNEKQSTRLYVMITEIFLFCKRYFEYLTDDNCFYFCYTHKGTSIKIEFYEDSKNINFKQVLELEKDYVEIISDKETYKAIFTQDGHRIVVNEKIR